MGYSMQTLLYTAAELHFAVSPAYYGVQMPENMEPDMTIEAAEAARAVPASDIICSVERRRRFAEKAKHISAQVQCHADEANGADAYSQVKDGETRPNNRRLSRTKQAR